MSVYWSDSHSVILATWTPDYPMLTSGAGPQGLRDKASTLELSCLALWTISTSLRPLPKTIVHHLAYLFGFSITDLISICSYILIVWEMLKVVNYCQCLQICYAIVLLCWWMSSAGIGNRIKFTTHFWDRIAPQTTNICLQQSDFKPK